MRLNSMEYAKYRVKCYNLYADVGGRCQCCGRYHYEQNVIVDNFCHIDSKNNMNKEQKINNIVFVCKSLHDYEHNQPANLKNDYCVKIFIDNHFNGFKDFWGKFIKDKGLKFL